MRYLFLLFLFSTPIFSNIEFISVVTEDSYNILDLNGEDISGPYPYSSLRPAGQIATVPYGNIACLTAQTGPGQVADTLLFFDPLTFSVIGSSFVQDVTFYNGGITSDGKIASASEFAGNSVVRNTNLREMSYTDIPALNFYGSKISNNGEFICGVNGDTQAMIYNLNSGNSISIKKIDGITPLNCYTFCISSDSTKIYVSPSYTNPDGSYIYVIDSQTGIEIDRIDTSSFTSNNSSIYRMQPSPTDSKLALVVRGNGQQIWILDLITNTFNEVPSLSTFCIGYGVIGKMAFSSDENFLYTYSLYNLHKIDVNNFTSESIKGFNTRILSIGIGKPGPQPEPIKKGRQQLPLSGFNSQVKLNVSRSGLN
ncbi:MAG: YncE family protein [Chlamydiia bacterium]